MKFLIPAYILAVVHLIQDPDGPNGLTIATFVAAVIGLVLYVQDERYREMREQARDDDTWRKPEPSRLDRWT